MDRPRCKTCPYWLADPDWERQPDELAEAGECRRSPPLPAGLVLGDGKLITQEPYQGVWVDTHECDGCGEHPDFPAYIASLKTPEPLPLPGLPNDPDTFYRELLDAGVRAAAVRSLRREGIKSWQELARLDPDNMYFKCVGVVANMQIRKALQTKALEGTR